MSHDVVQNIKVVTLLAGAVAGNVLTYTEAFPALEVTKSIAAITVNLIVGVMTVLKIREMLETRRAKRARVRSKKKLVP